MEKDPVPSTAIGGTGRIIGSLFRDEAPCVELLAVVALE